MRKIMLLLAMLQFACSYANAASFDCRCYVEPRPIAIHASLVVGAVEAPQIMPTGVEIAIPMDDVEIVMHQSPLDDDALDAALASGRAAMDDHLPVEDVATS